MPTRKVCRVPAGRIRTWSSAIKEGSRIMHEWPLMVFTLMAQASIGGLLLTLLLCVPRFASWTEPQRDEILRLPLLAFFAVGAIEIGRASCRERLFQSV